MNLFKINSDYQVPNIFVIIVTYGSVCIIIFNIVLLFKVILCHI